MTLETHLDAWLERSVLADDRDEARLAIFRYLNEDPDAIERGLSWREMLDRGELLS